MPEAPAKVFDRGPQRPVHDGQLSLTDMRYDTLVKFMPAGHVYQVKGEPYQISNGDTWMQTDYGVISLSGMGVAPYGDGTWEQERYAVRPQLAY